MSNTQNAEVTFKFRARDGIKREDVVVSYDTPTVEGLVEMLMGTDEKVKSFILESVLSVQQAYVRSFVDADTNFDQEKLNSLAAEGKISLEALANLPQSERNVTSKDDLEAFAKSYIKYMPELSGKSKESAEAAAGLFVERVRKVRGDHKILKALEARLNQYVDGVPQEVVAEHEKAISYLANQIAEGLKSNIVADDL